MSHALRHAEAPPVMPVRHYRGRAFTSAALPTHVEPWPCATRALDRDGAPYDASPAEVLAYTRGKPWVLPARTMYFFCDVHADADAFRASLAASGGVALTGSGDFDLELTTEGRAALFVIAGDCFDKGPNNVRLLRVIGRLIELGADVELLAGNHDLRTLVGIAYLGRKEPRFAHLFVRMGKKSVPLFKEMLEAYPLAPGELEAGPSEAELRALMFPPASWFDEFPQVAHGLINDKKAAKEVIRIREKIDEIEGAIEALGLSLRALYAGVARCRRQFLDPDGAFAWFFGRMRLCRRWGSFLLIHAGVDDSTAAVLRHEGVDGLNRRFDELRARDLFELYHGPIGNCFRTKYRDIDYPLGDRGVADMHRAGLYAIVHGHRNILHGQRVVMRRGLLNFECDASVDRNTRVLERLPGQGAAVVIFRGDGTITGISVDHPRARCFDLAAQAGLLTVV